jgi:hypothetical protein
MIKYRTDYSGQRQPETLLIKTTDGTSIWRIYFDIKDSLFADPKTYMIEVTINGDYMSLNNYLDKLSILEPEGE